MTTDSPIVFIAVTQLMAAYCYAVDHGNAREWAELFTETGCFVVADTSVVGHAALEEYANRDRRGTHVAGPPVISEATGEGCRVSSSFMFQYRDSGAVVSGYYDDQIVLVDRRPLFAFRSARMNWRLDDRPRTATDR